jgi:hypothetical protein
MSRFIVGEDRQQVTLLPECLDDFIAEDNTVRVVDAFISELDMVVPKISLGVEQEVFRIASRCSSATWGLCSDRYSSDYGGNQARPGLSFMLNATEPDQALCLVRPGIAGLHLIFSSPSQKCADP